MTAVRAWSRSRHRSSTSSMPTDSRSRSSGTVGDSVAKRRRRSSDDSTPPRLVAGTHSAQGVHDGVRRGDASDGSQADDRAEPGHQRGRALVPGVVRQRRVPDLRDRGVLGQPAGELGRGGLRALDAQRQRAQPAQREPDLPRSGDRAVQGAVGEEPVAQPGVVHHDGARARRRCARRGTSSPSARRRRRPRPSGRWPSGVAKVLSTATGTSAACAARRGPGRSATSSMGLVGDSTQQQGRRRGADRGHHGVGVGDVDPDHLDAGAGREVVGEPERDLVGVPGHARAARRPGTSESAAAMAAMPEEKTRAGRAAPSRSASARSNGTQVSVPDRA